jgi:hypothetical protein
VAHHCGGRRDRSASISRALVKKTVCTPVGKIRLQVIVDVKEQKKK